MDNFNLKNAMPEHGAEIWKILQFAIDSRKKDGSAQWQNGYPNPEVVSDDINKKQGFIFAEDEKIAAYCVLIKNDEPAYDQIEGKWLSGGDFLVVHRVAVSEDFAGRGVVQKLFTAIEDYAKLQGIPSIKVDTNFDNGAMLHILEKMDYQYCGKVWLAGGERMAFEKLLN